MKIDSHQHFWSVNRPNDYGFLVPEAGVLYRDYLPEDLQSHLIATGVSYTVLVQAAESLEETDYLLDIAAKTNFVGGVVGWINFDQITGAFEKQLQKFLRNPKFIGIRPMLQELPDDQFILKNQVIENVKLIASIDFPFDILVYPRHLPHIYEMLQKVPDLHAVIDHLAKPQIRSQQIDDWLNWMNKISTNTNVYCKLSGMVTEADHKLWQVEHFTPYVEAVINCFGAERSMFGSDWPVCLQAASYEQVVTLLEAALEKIHMINKEKLEHIFGTNAASFYRLKV
ncbi:MAG TPA: amidohydrolase family protein [Chryseolinea sp.]|nr:amidohydrolase family protein [Chryseolinea sp.]